MPSRRQALENIVLHATRLRIPIIEVEGGSLTAVSGFDGHQGVAVVVGPRRFGSVDEILARALARNEPAFVLALDSLEDPQNVGTLLRSAEAGGVHGVLFPTRHQAPLSPAAVKASAGATEHLLLAPVDDLADGLADLRARGLLVVGSDADAPLTARQADLRGPVAIVVGSEGRGLAAAVRRRCDLFVRIPMRGLVGSLNAAAAGTILVYEALAQRDPEGTHSVAGPAVPAGPDAGPPPRDEAAPAATIEPDDQMESPAADDPVESHHAGRSRPVAAIGRRSAPAPLEARQCAAAVALDPLGARAVSSPGTTDHLRDGSSCVADVAQLVEQRFCKPPVPGSSPVVGSNDHNDQPDVPRVRAHIAQLAEHFLGKEEVIGSSPIVGSTTTAPYHPRDQEPLRHRAQR